jgi:hypothetical protein
LLPKDQQLDIGTPASTKASSGVAPKRPREADDIVDPKDLSKLVEMQTKFFDYALGGHSHSASSSSASQSSMDMEIVSLQRLRNDMTLTPEQRKKVDTKYSSIIDKICLTSADLTA